MANNFIFSNFQTVKILHDDILYPSVEHYFQAQKTDNIQQKLRISQLQLPSQAKRIGRSLILRKDWNSVKLSVMKLGLQKKFSQEPFRSLLLNFEGDIIEYNYWHDNYWGSCLCSSCSAIPALNKLGKLLMEIKNELSNS